MSVLKSRTEEISIKSHFEGKDRVVGKIYAEILSALKKIGGIIQEPKQTSIHLVNKTALAGVATRKAHLILTIKSETALNSPRIHRTQQTSSRRFHHELKLVSPSDVDAQLIDWLKAAYELSC